MKFPERTIRVCSLSEENETKTCVEMDFKELAENMVVMTIFSGAGGLSTDGIASIIDAYLEGKDEVVVDYDTFMLLMTGVGFVQLAKDGVNTTFKN